MDGAIGAMPSQFLFDAQGRSESSAESAMQPDNIAQESATRSNPPTPRLRRMIPLESVSEDDVIGCQLVLSPGAENVADDVVLALDFLAEADAADELAGGALEARAADAELD